MSSSGGDGLQEKRGPDFCPVRLQEGSLQTDLVRSGTYRL